MNSPEIKTTVVGSYPAPTWLQSTRSAEGLSDAIMAVLKIQELAGIDVISDGELSRFDFDHPDTNGMIDYFVSSLGGVSTTLTRTELVEFRSNKTMSFRTQPAGVVHHQVNEGLLNLGFDWDTIKPLSASPLKFTLTSPYMLAKTLVDRHYGNIRALTMDIAAVLAKQVASIDAAVVQVDEANLPGNSKDGDWAHVPLNRVFDAIQGERGLHLCFGNYGGQTIQRGHWANLIPFLNNLNIDHVVLEFARRGYDELDVLQDLRGDIGLGIGVIDIKDNAVESVDIVARRIERAVDALGHERIKWVHPDCGFWMLSRSVADRKMQALVKGRDIFLGSQLTSQMAEEVFA